MVDELLNLSPTISDPQEVAAGDRNRPSNADLRPLEPLPQAPQSCYPPAADPGPMNPEDNRRLSVYPHVEVEPTADVCPSGPSRDAGDQGRDGRIIWAGSRSEPARQGRERGGSFDSAHGNSRPAHPRKGRPASMPQSCRDAMTADTPLPIQVDSRLPGGVGPLPASGAVLRPEGPTQRSESTPVVRVTTRGLVAGRVLDSGHTASDNVGCAIGVLAADARLVTGHRERA